MEYSAIDTVAATPLGARFTIERAPLLKAVSFMVKRIVERRNTIPILSNIAFRISDGAAQLLCTDLDLQAVTVLQCQTDSPGTFTLDATTLCDLLKKVPEGAQVTFAYDDGKVTVSAGRVRTRLQALPIDDMPSLTPPNGGISNAFTLSAEYARDFAALVPAISKEESRYYLNGVAIEASAGRLHMAATDGVTLAIIDRAAPQGADGLASSIIPRKAIAALLAATGKMPVALSVEISPRFVMFHVENMTITSKLIDGTFPNWRYVVETGLGADCLEPCAIPFMNDRLRLDAIAKLEKAASVTLSVDIGEKAAMLSSADYPEFCALSWLTPASANAKGFTRQRDDQEELRAIDYLTDLAQRAGLSTDFRDKHNKPAVRSHWAYGEAAPRMIGVTFGRIAEYASTRTEKREVVDYETFTTRTEFVQIETPETWQDGAYSVAMPREAVFDHRNATVAVQGDDGSYSDAQWLAQDKRGAVSLSADHVAMLCGPVDPSTFVHIPKIVFHRGEVVAIDGVATAAMPEGWTVNDMPQTGKQAKALRERMVTLARINTLEAARELRELAAQFEAIRPMRDYEINASLIAVDVSTSVAEIEADLTPVTAPETETAVEQGEPVESLHSPVSVAELVAVEPVSPPSAELADWQAFMVARFGAIEARLSELECHEGRGCQHDDDANPPNFTDIPSESSALQSATANNQCPDQLQPQPTPPIGVKERTPDAPAIAGMGLFRVCSGQSHKRAFGRGSDSDWGICLAWDYDHLAPWWRAETSNGRRMVYKTMEQAEGARLILEEKGWPQKLTARGIICPVGMPKKERTPAHVRAIMAYLSARKVRTERDKIMRALNKASDHRWDLRKSRDDWEGLHGRTYAKRARTVLAFRDGKRQIALMSSALLAARAHLVKIESERELAFDRMREFELAATKWQSLAEDEAQRTLVAETALTAVQARADGWPPAVRSVNVQFKTAA